jgi:hypothetical protein
MRCIRALSPIFLLAAAGRSGVTPAPTATPAPVVAPADTEAPTDLPAREAPTDPSRTDGCRRPADFPGHRRF